MISAQTVKELREKTGCGMMECKKALTECGGDMEKAIEYLRERGIAVAAKKAGRIASEGLVAAFTEDNVSVVLEVNSETDFVAKNEEFQKFVKDVAEQIIKNNPADVESLLTEKSLVDPSKTIDDLLKEKIATIGENMNIRRFVRYEGIAKTYVHGGGRIGVIVKFDLADPSKASAPEFDEYAKDMAMQIAAAFPQYLDKNAVPKDTLDKEMEILRQQALNEGKPEAIVDKMVMGRIAKFYKEVCLVEQPFIKDQDKSVTKVTKEVSDKIGTEIKIAEFARLEKGEGLEKREDNFADEVASMMK